MEKFGRGEGRERADVFGSAGQSENSGCRPGNCLRRRFRWSWRGGRMGEHEIAGVRRGGGGDGDGWEVVGDERISPGSRGGEGECDNGPQWRWRTGPRGPEGNRRDEKGMGREDSGSVGRISTQLRHPARACIMGVRTCLAVDCRGTAGDPATNTISSFGARMRVQRGAANHDGRGDLRGLNGERRIQLG